MLCRIVLTKTGQTSRTYVNTDATNPLITVSHDEMARIQTAEVVIDNSNSALSSLDFRGFQGVISNGYNTSAGDEYSAKPPLFVIAKRFESYGGGDALILSLASKVNQMGDDRASKDYSPDSSDTDTIQTIITAIANGTLSTIGTTDLAGAVKTLAAVGASSVVLKSLGTGTINKDTKFLIAGDDVEYTVTATATITANEATVSITPTLAVQADVDDVVTLLDIYSHCENIGIGGSIDEDKDPVINSFKPADFLRIRYRESRRAKIDELFSYTFTVGRIEADGSLHWLHFVNGQALDWTANTVIRKGETRKPTTDNGHVYICTTAGTTAGTEPASWTTTEGGTVSDGTVTWTLDYDYQYSQTAGDHIFWRKGKRLALVSPNRVTVESDPSHSTIYSGTAKDTDSNDLLDLRDKIRLRLASNAEATDIAKGNLGHHQLETDVGYFYAPFNVGLEIYDLIRLYDSSDGISLIGNVASIHNRYNGLTGKFDQLIRLGLNSANLDTRPSGLSYTDRDENSPVSFADLTYVYNLLHDRDLELLTLLDGIFNSDLATVTQLNTGTDALRVITPDVLAGSNLGTQGIGIIAVDFTTDVTVADGKAYIPIPAYMDGMNLIRAQAMVITAGTTNATTIDIYNVTDSQDMLSTAISIASGGTVGTVGTVDTTKDDVATNDVLRVDVTTVSTTKPKGLLIVLEFRIA